MVLERFAAARAITLDLLVVAFADVALRYTTESRVDVSAAAGPGTLVADAALSLNQTPPDHQMSHES